MRGRKRVKSTNCAWWVKRWSELYPQKPAIIFEEHVTTYADLDRRTRSVACWLQAAGIEKGDRVAVVLENCPEFIELYLACARLGAIFVPLNYRLTAEELDYVILNCRPRLVVWGDRVRTAIDHVHLAKYRPPLLPAMVGEVGIEDLARGIADYAAETAAFEGQTPVLTPSLSPDDLEDPQVIMYTSGTTGWPKGAVLTHRKAFFNCLNADHFFDMGFHDVMLIALPLFHSGGLFIQATPSLYKGATIILHRRFDPQRAYDDIERFQVTKFQGVPTVFRSLLRIERERRGHLGSLAVVAIGGERVTPEIMEQCGASGFPLRVVMGQTETSILLWATQEEVQERPGTVGRPVFHAEVDLMDENGGPVEKGAVGELVVRGSVTMKEYWQDPELTEKVMSGGWLRTGDLARRDEDGYYYLVDRVKDMYISAGENVYPAEVERILSAHPDVVEVAVVGVPDEAFGEVGYAFVMAREGASLDRELLADWARERLAGYKVPRYVSVVDDFPRTALGKVKKFLLRRDALAHLPRTTIQEA